MMISLLLLAASAGLSAEPAVAVSTAPAAMAAPRTPERDGKPIETTPALASDLGKTLDYLERGRAYYKAFTSGGSHTPAENKGFLRFLEDYERELGHAKKELAILKTWLDTNADLAAPQK